MTQITWRAPDDLVERVRIAATQRGTSLNGYLTSLARAATDPYLAESDLVQLRERLALAGLLAAAGTPRLRPPGDAVAAARRRAGTGTPVSDIVSDSRG